MVSRSRHALVGVASDQDPGRGRPRGGAGPPGRRGRCLLAPRSRTGGRSGHLAIGSVPHAASIWRRPRLDLPATSTRDEIETAIASFPHGGVSSASRFVGIGLGSVLVTGTAVRAADLAKVLTGRPLPESPVLVVDTLEPSWAVVFPRFSAVVSALGGELSHASILLREAGIPPWSTLAEPTRRSVTATSSALIPARGEVRVEERSCPEHRCAVQPSELNQPNIHAQALSR